MSVNKSLAVEITANSTSYTAALQQAARATETSAKRMETSLQQVGRGNNQMFQQVGFQINDVAAQVAAGGNVMQAAGMQVGQLLQAFGPWGAILGAAVAIGGSLAATLWDTDEAEKAAKKSTEDYADAVEFAKEITESSGETQRRHNEERRQGAIETLKAAKAEKELAAARLQMQISELETLRSYGDFDSAGAGDTSSTYHTAGVELERLKGLLTELQKSAATTGTSLQNVINPRAGWQDDFKPERPEKSTRVQSIVEEKDAVEEYIQSLRDAVEVQKLDERAGAIREATIRAQNMAMQDGTVLTDAQTEAIQRLAGASFDMAAAQKAAQEAQREADQRTKEELQENERLMKQVSMTFESAFEDAIIAGKKFSEVLNAIGEDIAKLIIRQAVTAPLGNAIQGAMSGINWGGLMSGAGNALSVATGGGGLAGNNFSLGTPSGYTPPAVIPRARAAGGPVDTHGPYLVGENGPELLQFGAPGSITPNNRLALGGGGGGMTVINQTLQISTGVAATVQSEIRNMLPTIANVTKAAISNDQARKGRSL